MAIREMEKVNDLKEITKWVDTIKNNSNKIVNKAWIIDDKTARKAGGLNRFTHQTRAISTADKG